jgi:hypothetical protein
VWLPEGEAPHDETNLGSRSITASLVRLNHIYKSSHLVFIGR